MNEEQLIFKEKPKSKNFIDIEGQTFNRLLVLGFAGRLPCGNQNHSYWYCQCSCENKTIVKVSSNSLKTNSIKSCGCWNIEVLKKTKYNS